MSPLLPSGIVVGIGATALAVSSQLVGQGVRDARRCHLSVVSESEPSAEFSFVTSIAVDSKRRTYVADRFVTAVTILSEDGRLIARVGRAGSGPGEFQFVWQVHVLPGDSLVTYDISQGRMTVFAPEQFEVAYTLTFAAAAPQLGAPTRIFLLADQRRIVAQYSQPFVPGEDPRRDYQPEQAVHVLNWDGTPARTAILTLSAAQSLVLRQRNAVGIAPFPFGWSGRLILGPGGRLYYGKGDSLHVQIFDLAGERVGRYSRPYTPPRISERDLKWAETQVSERFRLVLRQAAPKRWPAFRQFTVDDRGRMWIGLETPRGAPTDWHIVDPRGHVLCRFPLPEDVEVKLVNDDRIFAVRKDELDVPRIVVYQMVR